MPSTWAESAVQSSPGFPVAATSLHLRQAYAEACGRGTAVWRLGARGQDAAKEIDRLFREVLGSVAPKAIVSPRSFPISNLLPRGSFAASARSERERTMPAGVLGRPPGEMPAMPNPRRPLIPKE